jgi:hypothetical protein
MRAAFGLLLVACFCEAAVAQSGTPVGNLGDPEQLVIEGTKTFSAEKIKDQLVFVPGFHLAADSDAPLDRYLLTIERLIGAGYRSTGFRDVKVVARPDLKAHKINVQITEGPRFNAGEVRVRGNKTVPVAQLISRLTTKYPPKDAFVQSPVERRGQIEAQWVDANGKSVELCEAIWQPGKPATFLTAPEADSKLHRDIAEAFSDLGYRSAKFTVDVVTDQATKKANLVVDISDEGRRSVLSKLEVTGNKINSQDDIIKYVGFKPGTPATRDEVVRIQSKLWQSGRFIRSWVTVHRSAKVADDASLHVNVSELLKATPLKKPLTPEEEILLKCRSWLADYSHWDGDVSCKVTSGDNSCCVVFSPTEGVLMHVVCKGPSVPKPVDCVGVLSTGEMGFYNSLDGRKISMPTPNGQLIGSLAISVNDGANDARDSYRYMSFGLGSKTCRLDLQSPFDLALSIAPVYFVDIAHAPDTTVSIRNGVLAATSPKTSIYVDVKSGRLLQYVETWFDDEADQPSQNKNQTRGYDYRDLRFSQAPSEWPIGKTSDLSPVTLRLSTVSGEFQRRLNAIHAKTAKAANAFDANRPITSVVRFACKEDVFWRFDGAEKYDKERVLIGRMADKNVFEPLDEAWMGLLARYSDSSKSNESLSIPGFVAVSKTFNFDPAGSLSAVTFIVSKLSPPGSWPEVMGRDLLLTISGHADAADVELLRLCKSGRNGPLCFLTAGCLLTQSDPTMAKVMASRGLRRLSLDDFRKEHAVFLNPQYPMGRFTMRVANYLRDADDHDIETLASLLPIAAASPFRQAVVSLRKNRNQPVNQALPTLLDSLWQKGLRDRVKAALESLEIAARPYIQQSRNQLPPVLGPAGKPVDLGANAFQAGI